MSTCPLKHQKINFRYPKQHSSMSKILRPWDLVFPKSELRSTEVKSSPPVWIIWGSFHSQKSESSPLLWIIRGSFHKWKYKNPMIFFAFGVPKRCWIGEGEEVAGSTEDLSHHRSCGSFGVACKAKDIEKLMIFFIVGMPKRRWARRKIWVITASVDHLG